ncbi:MAG: gliding motility-associated C-terminal domain-containing protein, partial [Cytophagales bacterium]
SGQLLLFADGFWLMDSTIQAIENGKLVPHVGLPLPYNVLFHTFISLNPEKQDRFRYFIQKSYFIRINGLLSDSIRNYYLTYDIEKKNNRFEVTASDTIFSETDVDISVYNQEKGFSILHANGLDTWLVCANEAKNCFHVFLSDACGVRLAKTIFIKDIVGEDYDPEEFINFRLYPSPSGCFYLRYRNGPNFQNAEDRLVLLRLHRHNGEITLRQAHRIPFQELRIPDIFYDNLSYMDEDFQLYMTPHDQDQNKIYEIADLRDSTLIDPPIQCIMPHNGTPVPRTPTPFPFPTYFIPLSRGRVLINTQLMYNANSNHIYRVNQSDQSCEDIPMKFAFDPYLQPLNSLSNLAYRYLNMSYYSKHYKPFEPLRKEKLFTQDSLCEGNALVLRNSQFPTADSVKWLVEDTAYRFHRDFSSSSYAIKDSALHYFKLPGVYTIKAIRYLSCFSDTLSHSLKVIPKPKPQIPNFRDTLFNCVKGSSLLEAPLIPGFRYVWTNFVGNKWDTLSQNHQLLLRLNHHPIITFEMVANCYHHRDTFSIQYPKFEFDLKDTFNLCNQEVTLKVKPFFGEYEVIDNGDLIKTIQPFDSLLTLNQPGFYLVFARYGKCRLAYDTFLIEEEGSLEIPNVITPNGDGLNDSFRIVGSTDAGKLSIFNRWGTKIYENNAYDQSWGSGQDNGVYFYHFQLGGCEHKGWVEVK